MIYIISNPVSGKGKGEECLERVYMHLNDRGAEYVSFISEYAGHSTKLAQVASAQPDCEKVIAIGGDGTFSEVLQGINLNVPVAFVPAGTGNDFVSGAGLPVNPEEIIDLALSDSVGEFDIMTVNDGRCLNVAGSGFDVDVLIAESKMRKYLPGKISYMIALITSLLCFKFSNVTVSVDDGEERKMSVLLLAAANGKYYGGGMPISPDAKCDDGYMDLIVIKKLPRYKIPYVFVKFLAGKLMEVKKYVEFHRCKKVSFSILPKLPINIDGELIDTENARIEILPGALKVVCADANKLYKKENTEKICVNV